MTRPDRAATYGTVLRLSGAPRAFTAATLGRLSYATMSLSLLVTVEHATGSYATAGTALAAFALASVAMPAKSRLVDHHGQRRVLPALSVAFAGSLLAIVGATVLGTTATWTYLALAVMAGIAAPPLGPSMRALWAALTPDLAMRQRAYSLDGVVEEAPMPSGPCSSASSSLSTAGQPPSSPPRRSTSQAAPPWPPRHSPASTPQPTSPHPGPACSDRCAAAGSPCSRWPCSASASAVVPSRSQSWPGPSRRDTPTSPAT